MSLFGLFDSKKTSTTSTTSTSQTDNSKNVGEGATFLESGAQLTVNDVSAEVANAALAANVTVADAAINKTGDVAGSALTLAALNSADAFKFATQVADKTVETVAAQNRNTTLAAQDAVSYGRQLAELGFASQVDARKSETDAILGTLGKYGAWGLAAVAALVGLYLWNRKKA